jgi:hypothetical protein
MEANVFTTESWVSLAKTYHTVAKGSPQSEKASAWSLEAWRLHDVVMKVPCKGCYKSSPWRHGGSNQDLLD